MIDRSEELVTVFGGDGFIGRYVCEFLLRSGVRVRVASRDPRNSYFIQPLGQVGQFGFVQADITDLGSVQRAVDGAIAVINLVGVFGRQAMAVNSDGAMDVAKAARAAGVSALVHVSAIGADPSAKSVYAASKGEGEINVCLQFKRKDAGPTIVRPSLAFGPEDNLTNRFAQMARLPVLPVIAAKTKFQPVYVRDLARAIALAALDPARHGGKTYEIAGPQVMSMLELHRAIFDITGQKPELVPAPDVFGSLLSRFGWLPGSPLTRDQWLMLQRDNVASGDRPGLEAFSIEATPLAAVAGEWLGRYGKPRFTARRIHLNATS